MTPAIFSSFYCNLLHLEKRISRDAMLEDLTLAHWAKGRCHYRPAGCLGVDWGDLWRCVACVCLSSSQAVAITWKMPRNSFAVRGSLPFSDADTLLRFRMEISLKISSMPTPLYICFFFYQQTSTITRRVTAAIEVASSVVHRKECCFRGIKNPRIGKGK